MPGQYYYRPVSSGHDDLGRSLAAGITGGVGNYYQGKDDQRRRRLEDEDRSIAAEDRTRRRSREDLDLDVYLDSLGGGQGQQPTPSSLPPEGTALRNHTGLEIRRNPDAVQNRDYRQFGDFFFENADSRRERLEREEFGLAEGRRTSERERLSGTLAGPAAALVGGSRRPDDLGAFYGEGLNPVPLMDESRPKPPVRGTPEYDAMLRREGKIAQDYRGEPEDDYGRPGSPEWVRTTDYAIDMMSDYGPDGVATGLNRFTDEPMTPDEVAEVVAAILRNDPDPFATMRSKKANNLLERAVRNARPGSRGGPAAALTSPRSPGRGRGRGAGPATSAPAASAAATDSLSIRAEAERLAEEGLSRDEIIRRITEARRKPTGR